MHLKAFQQQRISFNTECEFESFDQKQIRFDSWNYSSKELSYETIGFDLNSINTANSRLSFLKFSKVFMGNGSARLVRFENTKFDFHIQSD